MNARIPRYASACTCVGVCLLGYFKLRANEDTATRLRHQIHPSASKRAAATSTYQKTCMDVAGGWIYILRQFGGRKWCFRSRHDVWCFSIPHIKQTNLIKHKRCVYITDILNAFCNEGYLAWTACKTRQQRGIWDIFALFPYESNHPHTSLADYEVPTVMHSPFWLLERRSYKLKGESFSWCDRCIERKIEWCITHAKFLCLWIVSGDLAAAILST